MRFWLPLALLVTALPHGSAVCQQGQGQVSARGTQAVADAQWLPAPNKVWLGGLLGTRYTVSEKNRLLLVDEDELLAGFRHRPGKQAWVGEHVGKWLHAASLCWAETHDANLRAKLNRVVTALLKTQEPDGYLGTYVPSQRFGMFDNADWDVWVHKYCILGLTTYYQYTGNRPALSAAERAAYLVMRTFTPGGKSILTAGQHVGMAATSVLEPIVVLYRITGNKRYLEFANYIVTQWELPQGPHILSALEKYGAVTRVGNGKAYEMLSNFVGLAELYRATGVRRYLDDLRTAWSDVVANRLQITGSGSSFEHWTPVDRNPIDPHSDICETCVTVTWEQLNIELLRLLGDARYADQLERSVYNHLLAAQRPSGEAWAYYTPLEGTKPYSPATTCCLSSGPRGIALLPVFAVTGSDSGPVVNLFTKSKAEVRFGAAGRVIITQDTTYPMSGSDTITVTPVAGPRRFALRLRWPAWAPTATAAVNGTRIVGARSSAGYLGIVRLWKAGDRVTYTVEMPTVVVPGKYTTAGRAAIEYGPLVLAYDYPLGAAASTAVPPLATLDSAGLKITGPTGDVSRPIFTVQPAGLSAEPVRLTAYYAAGAAGQPFEVWLPVAGPSR